ncbi:MAG: MBL fold metallo-hydrolase [Verrucomicrobiota bacterium]|nr:MBL fold metallo-hydrolase [Verrucomicrobiota bacterium]
MKTNCLECMGVGDGWPCADRAHAAFLYRFGTATVLVDSGEPISGLIDKANIAADEIDSVLITHLHMDHVGGLFMLLQGLWLEGRTKPLPVHMPAEGIEPVRAMLRAGYVFDELLKFDLEFVPIKAGQQIRIGRSVRVTPLATSHLSGLKRRFGSRSGPAFDAFSFLIESGRTRVVHSGDVGTVADLEPLLDRPVDVLVCELAHVGLEELGEFLKGRKVKQVVLVHLPESMWRDLPETRRSAEKALGKTSFAIPTGGEAIAF